MSLLGNPKIVLAIAILCLCPPLRVVALSPIWVLYPSGSRIIKSWASAIFAALNISSEEEFGLVQAYQWSPDGKKIAYLKFDEENVNSFSMDIFKGQLYPSSKTFKYPKAGEENSVVNLYIYDLDENKTKFIYCF